MIGLRRRMVAVIVLAGVALQVLLAMGTGPVAPPPARSWSAAVEWYERVGPAVAIASALRLVAIAGLAWLLVGATLQLVASLCAVERARRVADALSPRALGRVARGAASLSVTAGLALPTVSLGATPVGDPPGTAVMEVLDEASATTSPAPAPAATQPERPAAEVEVVVAVGDSFWTLAEAAVAAARDGSATEREVANYWRRLIEANRSRLVAPDNPDLLFPAQTLTLPAVDPSH